MKKERKKPARMYKKNRVIIFEIVYYVLQSWFFLKFTYLYFRIIHAYLMQFLKILSSDDFAQV